MLIKPYIELQQLMERKGYNQKELAAAISRRLNGYSPATLSNRLVQHEDYDQRGGQSDR